MSATGGVVVMARPYAAQVDLVRDHLVFIEELLRGAIDGDTVAQARDETIRARLAATKRAADEFPIVRLFSRLALTPTEQRVIWLLVAHELSPVARRAIRDLCTEQVSDATTDVLRRVVYGGDFGARVWEELGAEGPLRRYALVEPAEGGGDVPDHRQTWKASRRVLSLVHGKLQLDPVLAKLARIRDEPSPAADALEVSAGACEQLALACARDALVIVQGSCGTGRRSLLAAILRDRGCEVLEIDGASIAKAADAACVQLRALARECALLGLVPMVASIEALAAAGETPDRFELLQHELPGLVVATASRPIARRWKRAPSIIELGALRGAQRAALWSRALPMAQAGDAEILATMYPIAPAYIHAAGAAAVARCGDEAMTPAHIEAGLRSVLDDRLAGLATRIEVTQTWTDLVLPDDQLLAITELMARIRERQRVYEDWGFAAKVGRGLGVSALFSGPPGTGKTMAAGLIARALRVDVYRVDLEKIVSKWIGETEKNLAALFDAAEAGHAVLLFDEADALFGKRTEVKSSNDRHANQEVNFLLQRLETFTGICILTTNHDAAIDEAFRRRLSVHVRFPMPEPDERARLWQAMLPEAAPRAAELGIEALAAKYHMSGGYIRNAVLRAAFLAADEDGEIDAARLARAAQLEYEALGKLASR